MSLISISATLSVRIAARRIAVGRPFCAPRRDQDLGGVAAEVLDHPLDVVGVGEQLELRRDVDRVDDRPGAFGLGGLDHLTHQLAQVDAPRRRRLLASAAVSKGRLAEQDRAVERRHQPRRKALGERVGNGAQDGRK